METDIIIIGGGLAGGTLAQGLALAGHRVTVIDAGPPPTHKPEDKRTLAIGASSQHLLDHLGIWNALAGAITPINRITLSDTSPEPLLTFDMHDQERPEPLGYMLQHGALCHAVYKAATAHKQVTWLNHTKPVEFSLIAAGIQVKFEDDISPIKAKLLIGADGKNSWVRSQLAIPTHRWDYDQTAVIALLSHPYGHRHVAAEHFTASGPLAFLPMEGQTSGLVWSVPDTMGDLLLEDQNQAERLINNAFQDHRGPVSLLGPLTCYPLEAVIPRRCVSERVCLIGDAAHSMHPVAGQGLNVGFRDIECLLNHLAEAHYLGLDLGSITLLKDYAKKRRFDHMSMMAATDGVVRIFDIPHKPIRGLRRFGLQALNYIPFMKLRMMRHAMGY